MLLIKIKIFTILFILNLPAFMLAQTFNNKPNMTKNQFGNNQIEKLQSLATSFSKTSYEKAIDYAKQALVLSEQNNDLTNIFSTIKLLSNLYMDNDMFNEAISISNKGVKYSMKINDQNQIAEFYINIGISYNKLAEFHQALEYDLKAYAILEKSLNKDFLSIITNNIGIIYAKLNDYYNALNYYLKSLTIKQDLDDKVGIARTMVNIGNIYLENKDFTKALEYYNQSLKVSREVGLKYLESQNLNNIGNIYQLLNSPKYALEYHQKALKIRIDLNDKKSIAYTYNNIGNSLDALGKYQQAFDYYTKELEIYKKTFDDTYGLAHSFLNLGTISLKLEKPAKSKEYLDYCNKLVDENDITELKASVYYGYSIYYFYMKEYKKSDEYNRLCDKFKDSIYNVDLKKNIAEMQVRYESDKKDKENKYLKLENDSRQSKLNEQRRFIFIWIILSILSLGLAVVIYKFYITKRNTSRILGETNKELEHTNQRLIKSDENLRYINATKDKFFSIIAHDLRNPFASLLLSVEMLNRYYERIEKDQLERIINTITQTVNQSNDLLTNLLEWARTQTNGLTFQPEMLHLTPIVLDVLPLVKGSAFPKNISIETIIDRNLIVFADLNMLNTIFRNLISNAIKFTPRDGKIIISAKPKGNFIEISIADNGVGIEPENLDKLFLIDAKIKTKGTDNETGTGLGLIITNDFVKKHGGSIIVESEFGIGSTFTFTLPNTSFNF